MNLNLSKLEVGLDLTDAEDRALFRQRVHAYLSRMGVWAIVEHAAELGVPVKRNVSRTVATRAVAEGWMNS